MLGLLTGCCPHLGIAPEDVVAEINEALKPGDGSDAIEAYFKKAKLSASYDNFANRYQGIIRHPESNCHAIVIYVNVDENGKFVSVEVRDSYTFL